MNAKPKIYLLALSKTYKLIRFIWTLNKHLNKEWSKIGIQCKKTPKYFSCIKRMKKKCCFSLKFFSFPLSSGKIFPYVILFFLVVFRFRETHKKKVIFFWIVLQYVEREILFFRFFVTWLGWLSSNNLYLNRINLNNSVVLLCHFITEYFLFHVKVIYLNITWQKPFGFSVCIKKNQWIIAQFVEVNLSPNFFRQTFSLGVWMMNFTHKASIDLLRVMHK